MKQIRKYLRLVILVALLSAVVSACGFPGVKWQDATAHNPNIEAGVVATTARRSNLGIREIPIPVIEKSIAIRREPLAIFDKSESNIASAKKITDNPVALKPEIRSATWESLNPGLLLLAPLLGISIALILDIIDRVAAKRRRKKRAKVESEKTRPADEI